MAEAATAVKRTEEPAKPIQPVSIFDQVEDTFKTIARRAYEIFETNGREFGRDLENWFRAERELLHPVPLNITESDSSLELKAEVPGFTEKELEIGVEPSPPDDCRQAGNKEGRKEGQDHL